MSIIYLYGNLKKNFLGNRDRDGVITETETDVIYTIYLTLGKARVLYCAVYIKYHPLPSRVNGENDGRQNVSLTK